MVEVSILTPFANLDSDHSTGNLTVPGPDCHVLF